MNTRLIVPSEEYLAGYLEARKEFRELGLLDSFDTYVTDETPPEEIVGIYEDRKNGLGLPEGHIPASTFWLVDGDDFIGLGNVRHRLTEKLRIMGGHVGYAIRPSRWQQGYGTLILKYLLKEAAALDLPEVLLTCNALNAASYRIMEKNGGVRVGAIEHEFEGRMRRTLHYIIKTDRN